MKQNLHFIVTSENGKTISFSFPKFWIKTLTIISLLYMLCLFTISIGGVHFFIKSNESQNEVLILSNDLEKSISRIKKLNKQVKNVEEEKNKLIKTVVADLTAKNRLIESIFSTVGINLEIQESRQNSGGPFIPAPDNRHKKLISRTERYLETIKFLPIGAPVPGIITSKYGTRKDPINRKAAFHGGVDIRGKRGTKIRATADGTVSEKKHTKGRGYYLVIDHHNGYVTTFSHLKKILVNKNDKIVRGQVIGELGNSGRSTGPHLHYEIHFEDKPIDPIKYLRVARYLP